MIRNLSLLFALVLSVAACAPPIPQTSVDGTQQQQRVYRVNRADAGKIQFRMLDSVNALRQASARGAVQLDSKLNAAAATHSRDMSVQNRPWHFGSDGSSPIDRINRVGYAGPLVGETISETFESELETLAAWMDQPDTRRIILAPEARKLGFSWHQEPGGKIWWTMVLGG